MSKKGQSSDNKELQCMVMPAVGTGESVATVVGTAYSSQLSAGIYRIHTTVDINFGTNNDGATPATLSDPGLSAGDSEYFEILNNRYIAILSSTAGGNVTIVRLP